MDVITLEVQPRQTGSKHARASRKSNEVPAVLYGRHLEPVHFTVQELTLQRLVESGELSRVEIKLEDGSYDAILKSVDFDPITDRPRHADFQALTKGEMITVTVPVQLHGTPVGLKEGGDIQVVTNEVEVRCVPNDIPSHIDVDISNMAIGDTIHLSDVTIEGVEIITPGDRTIVTVVPPRVVAEPEEELDELVGEGEAEDEETEGGEEEDTREA
jgi:large subunit ribosomal protein L25